MMKRFVCAILIFMTLCFSGCSSHAVLVGVWEEETQISILGNGVEEPTSVSAIVRFTFQEDGTGRMETIISAGKYPDSTREFQYVLKEDTLNMDFGEGQAYLYEVNLNGDTLDLKGVRGDYHLTRAGS